MRLKEKMSKSVSKIKASFLSAFLFVSAPPFNVKALEENITPNEFDSNYILLIAPIVILIIVIILWYKYKPKTKSVETVEFYPPEGLNTLEVGYLYKGYISYEEVSSLLMYFSNQGYFKIENVIYLNKPAIKITKLKEYDGNKESERIFMEELFKYNGQKANEIIMNETMHIEEYEKKDRNIRLNVDPVLLEMQRKIAKSVRYEYLGKAFSIKNLKIKEFILILMFIASICSCIPATFTYGNASMFPWIIILTLICPIIIIRTLLAPAIMVYQANHKPTNTKFVGKIIIIIILLFFISVAIIVTIAPSLFINPIYFVGYFVGLICISVMAIFYETFSTRTKYGDEIKGRIAGFKDFLEKTEKDKIETLVKDDPDYFYKIYPYAYVLGITNIWDSKYNEITKSIPVNLLQDQYGIVGMASFIIELEKVKNHMNSR